LPASPNNFQQMMQGLINALDKPLIGALALFLSAMMCMLIIGNPMIAWLQNKRWKKGTTLDETWTVREDTPDTHQAKAGTPSMGGLGIMLSTILALIAVTSAILVGADLLTGRGVDWMSVGQIFRKDALFLYVIPVVLISHGALGFADDWSKASGRGGLQARYKLFWQFLLGMAFLLGYFFWVSPLSINPHNTSINNINFAGLLFLLVFMVATCNAVNLTDGIDGLAAGLAVQVGIVLFSLDYHSHNDALVSAFASLALAGACLGFLNFNKHKARVFMGDTGSLAIGAALGAGAILQHAVFLLPFIGFIFFVEAASVTLQVLWFKYTRRTTGEGKRLFRRAPLHHHFELGGWSEWRVVIVFWLVNLLTSAIGLWLWHAGVLPRWP
jgi:phospho-N-acetylmuramoyl-pentapeptide-transferase